MIDDDAPRRTEAIVHRGRWPGLVWAIPLAALLIVVWLGLRAVTQRGETVTLDVPTADGVRTGDTHVTYNGLEIGAVSGIALAPDGEHIRLTMHVNKASAGLFRERTQLWVIGAQPLLNDIRTLRAALTGPSIGVVPGAGAPRRAFVAPAYPLIGTPGTKGMHYRLIARDLVSITPGTSIFTHGIQVGAVQSVTPRGSDDFLIDAFVREPFTRLVTRSTHFWDAAAFQLTRGAGGLQARLTSPSIAALGGISFETPPYAPDRTPAPAGSAFTFYADAGSADAAPVGLAVPYQLALGGDVGGLVPGAPVQLRGYTVGRVTGTDFRFEPATGAIATPVTISLDAARLHVAGSHDAVDAMMSALARRGMRARLAQSPPLVGSYSIALDIDAHAGAGRLRPGSPYPFLPAAGGSGGDLAGEAGLLLNRFNAIPIEQIGRNVRALTANLARVTGSPKVTDSLDHLDRALTTLDRTIQGAAPQIGPTVTSLREAAASAKTAAAAASELMGGGGGAQDADIPAAVRQLTEAARALRSFSDYLSRHPEALIKGRKEK